MVVVRQIFQHEIRRCIVCVQLMYPAEGKGNLLSLTSCSLVMSVTVLKKDYFSLSLEFSLKLAWLRRSSGAVIKLCMKYEMFALDLPLKPPSHFMIFVIHIHIRFGNVTKRFFGDWHLQGLYSTSWKHLFCQKTHIQYIKCNKKNSTQSSLDYINTDNLRECNISRF